MVIPNKRMKFSFKLHYWSDIGSTSAQQAKLKTGFFKLSEQHQAWMLHTNTLKSSNTECQHTENLSAWKGSNTRLPHNRVWSVWSSNEVRILNLQPHFLMVMHLSQNLTCISILALTRLKLCTYNHMSACSTEKFGGRAFTRLFHIFSDCNICFDSSKK